MNSTPESVDAPVEPAPDEIVVEETDAATPAPVVDPDPTLLESHDLALAALREITPAATIGDAAGYRLERDGVVSLSFENRLAGYPGWFWTVSLARVEGDQPTVLEVELLPGDDALLAPDWVPWAVRLADYQAAQVALAEAPHASDDEGESDEDDEDLDDVDDLDAADFDGDGSSILHAGDVDGVDIDELDDSDEDDEDDEDDADEVDEDDSEDDDEDEDEDEDADSEDDSEEDDADEDDDDSEDDSDEDDDAEE
ncbi:DUF3027 domain-containing protein [Microbacterium sp. Root180]|uniref:DUF3027 domain-containing protein n=1 Tax=Microbacterium sp. Root180 TaxID=1736483 RepID=UPI0007017439|nr:DUF3027 domain-containing protein [Microbacterium sp. Root180]KRB38903.1 DNA primase [Microbacterium sp. Root180]